MKGDYLTRLGDWPISGEGQIEHPDWGPVLFDALFLDEMNPGDSVELSVYREGKQVILKREIDLLTKVSEQAIELYIQISTERLTFVNRSNTHKSWFSHRAF